MLCNRFDEIPQEQSCPIPKIIPNILGINKNAFFFIDKTEDKKSLLQDFNF